MRYFPDLTWETANDIVETAFVNDIALVRIVNSVVRRILITWQLYFCIRISNVSRIIFPHIFRIGVKREAELAVGKHLHSQVHNFSRNAG